MKKQSFRYLITKMVLAMVLVMGFALVSAPSAKAQAAKMTNKKAQKILKKEVKNKFCNYAFIDLDNDKIDEMVVLGYSGKFYQGDDKKKTVNIYKVVGKKAESIFNDSIKGDIFHPAITFGLYRDAQGITYIKVNKEHEDDCIYVTYTLNNGSLVEVLRKEVLNAEFKYFVNSEPAERKEYDDFLSELYKNEIEVDVKTPSTKVTNKYVRKLIKAEFEFECKNGVFNKDIVSPIFSDEDGDGIDELIVREGPLGGKILYAYKSEYSYDYLVDSWSYSL